MAHVRSYINMHILYIYSHYHTSSNLFRLLIVSSFAHSPLHTMFCRKITFCLISFKLRFWLSPKEEFQGLASTIFFSWGEGCVGGGVVVVLSVLTGCYS